MDIVKHYIASCILKQQQVKKLMDMPLGNGFTDENILDFFKQALDAGLISSFAITNKTADLLQLIQNSENYKQYSLDDIGKRYLLALTNLSK